MWQATKKDTDLSSSANTSNHLQGICWRW